MRPTLRLTPPTHPIRSGSWPISGSGRKSPRSSDDAQLAFAVGHVADHPKLVLELGEVALLGFLARLGVALFALGLFGGLVAEIRDRQLAAEHVVAPKPQFGFGGRRKGVANFDQLGDQFVERGMILD